MALVLPYPSLVFVPLDKLTAEEMNQIVANYEAIAAAFPLKPGSIGSNAVGSNEIDWSSVCAYDKRAVNHWDIETWRFGGGLQIVGYKGQYTGSSVNIPWGSLFCGSVKPPDFPLPFIDVPTVNHSWEPVGGGSNAWTASRAENGLATETNPGGINIVRPTEIVLDGTVHITAIGPWK